VKLRGDALWASRAYRFPAGLTAVVPVNIVAPHRSGNNFQAEHVDLEYGCGIVPTFACRSFSAMREGLSPVKRRMNPDEICEECPDQRSDACSSFNGL
jgi:hypothetical protein